MNTLIKILYIMVFFCQTLSICLAESAKEQASRGFMIGSFDIILVIMMMMILS